jgi:hypothetical protein
MQTTHLPLTLTSHKKIERKRKSHSSLSGKNTGAGTSEVDEESGKKDEEKTHKVVCTKKEREMNLLHDLLGHLSWYTVDHLARADAVTGLPVKPNDILRYTSSLSGSHMRSHDTVCHACALAKGHRLAFATMSTKPKAPYNMYRISTDLCGPVKVKGQERMVELIGTQEYLSLIVDEHSRFMSGWIISGKDKAIDHLRTWIPQAEKLTGRKLVYFLSDDGGEYRSNELKAFLTGQGVTIEQTTVHTPQHNARVERANRSVFEMTRALLYRANLGTVFWGYAMNAAIEILNHRIMPSHHMTKTPMELWTGLKPDISHFRVFGCDAYAHVSQDANSLTKLEPRMVPCIHLGNSEKKEKGYLVYIPSTHKIVTRRDVVHYQQSFTLSRDTLSCDSNDGELLRWADASEKAINEMLLGKAIADSGTPEKVNGPHANRHDLAKGLSRGSPAPDGLSQSSPAPDVYGLSRGSPAPDGSSRGSPAHNVLSRGSTRASRGIAPSRYGFPDLRDFTPESLSQLNDTVGEAMMSQTDNSHCDVQDTSVREPLTYGEAMQSAERAHWQKAMDEEIAALKSNNTWQTMPLPPHAHAIGCKWIYKVKLKSDGSIERYKARLCAKGFSQKQGIDYHETFAPVMKYKSQRVLLSLATVWAYEADQMDVVTAFLNGEMKEEVYMQQPEGYVSGDATVTVCKLIKTLYGTKQAPREWNAALNSFLVDSLHMTRCVTDTCIYVKRSHTNHLFLIGVFVDDMTCVFSPHDRAEWSLMKADIQKKFKTKDQGPVSWMLGMEIKRDRERGTLSISNELLITKVVDKFRMNDCKPATTPEEPTKLTKSQSPTTDEGKTEMEKKPYRSAVGSIAYIALSSRPDITHAVNEVSSHFNNPGQAHWIAVLKIIRYLKGTKGKTLVFASPMNRATDLENYVPIITAFSDADYAGCPDTRRSTTGYVVKLDGNTITWVTKRQQSVALSSCESEYMAITEAAKEVTWLRQFMAEILSRPNDAIKNVTIFTDNQAAKLWCENDQDHNRSKHVDTKYHFVRDGVKRGMYKIEWISTQDQQADILTKGVGKIIFERLRDKVMDATVNIK